MQITHAMSFDDFDHDFEAVIVLTPRNVRRDLTSEQAGKTVQSDFQRILELIAEGRGTQCSSDVFSQVKENMQILRKVKLVHEHCLALLQIAFETAGGKAHFFRKHGLITTEGAEANEKWILRLIYAKGTLRIIKEKPISQQHNTELHNRVKQC